MKKLLILAMVLALGLSGCAQFKTTVCNQNADQLAKIAQQLADASDALAFFEKLTPDVPVLAIIAGLKLTISTLTKMREGYCATPEEMVAVSQAVDNSKAMSRSMKKGKELKLQ